MVAKPFSRARVAAASPRGEPSVRELGWLRARPWQSPRFVRERSSRRTQNNSFARAKLAARSKKSRSTSPFSGLVPHRVRLDG
jgi:hypothetical protein